MSHLVKFHLGLGGGGGVVGTVPFHIFYGALRRNTETGMMVPGTIKKLHELVGG